MSTPDWIQTKKECEVDQQGNYTVTRVTLERRKNRIGGLEKKDVIDLVLKVTGLTAIFIPVYLFYLSQKAEMKRQKFLLQFETFSAASSAFQNLLGLTPNTDPYISLKKRIFIEIAPKIYTLSDQGTIAKFDSIKSYIDLYDTAFASYTRIDSLCYYAKQVFSSHSSPQDYDSATDLNISFAKYAQISLELLDSIRRDCRSEKDELILTRSGFVEPLAKKYRRISTMIKELDARMIRANTEMISERSHGDLHPG